jgi:FeS assembly SUF system protein
MNVLEIKRDVVELLKTLYDPELPVNIWDLGLIYAVDVSDEGDIFIIMTLTSPNCPVIDILPLQVEEVAKSVNPEAEVVVDLVWEPSWDESLISDSAKLDLGLI